jgi:predicted PolB exonuclease-like 3'-5' exonuclease
MKIKYLVHDIETIPETEIAGTWDSERAALVENGKEDPFPPLAYHKVITIGMLALDDKFHAIKGGCAAGGLVGGKSEKEMIERWSSVVANEGAGPPLRMVDWHGRGFDVPVLQTRAFRYGIQLPWYFGLQPDNRGEKSSWSKEYRDRYAGAHDDLAELWTGRGAFAKPRMADLARLIGLPGKVGIDGSKVYETWKNFQWAKKDGEAQNDQVRIAQGLELARQIDRYCMQDVIQTAFIFQRYHYMTGTLSLDAYRAAAQNLIGYTRGVDPKFAEQIDRFVLLME